MNTIKLPVTVNLLPGPFSEVLDRIGCRVCQGPHQFCEQIERALNFESEFEQKLKAKDKEIDQIRDQHVDDSDAKNSLTALTRQINRLTDKLAEKLEGAK